MASLVRYLYKKRTIEQLQNEVLSQLRSGNAVIIKNFPCSTYTVVTDFIYALGNPITAARSAIEGSKIIQKVRKYVKPRLDPYGHEILSTTSGYFPLHTDNYCNQTPADIIGLLCQEPSASGGESLYLGLDEIRSKLPYTLFESLCQPLYQHPSGLRPIITGTKNSQKIFFNERDILLCDKGADIKMEARSIECIKLFSAFLEKETKAHKLEKKDLLLINNTRMLHGRNSFPDSGTRRFLRFRISWKD